MSMASRAGPGRNPDSRDHSRPYMATEVGTMVSSAMKTVRKSSKTLESSSLPIAYIDRANPKLMKYRAVEARLMNGKHTWLGSARLARTSCRRISGSCPLPSPALLVSLLRQCQVQGPAVLLPAAQVQHVELRQLRLVRSDFKGHRERFCCSA